MMNLTHKACSWALVLLGVAHMSFTAVAYKSWSLGAAWFLGAGLAMVVLGFLNLVAAPDPPRRAIWFCLIANLLAFVYIVAVTAILAEPQAFVGVLLLLILLGTTAHRLLATGKSRPAAPLPEWGS